jgi:hypothetical protein
MGKQEACQSLQAAGFNHDIGKPSVKALTKGGYIDTQGPGKEVILTHYDTSGDCKLLILRARGMARDLLI